MVAFGGMVVNDVQNHFQAGSMQFANHFLELHNLSSGNSFARVTAFGREKTDRVVPPIVGQAFVLKNTVIDMFMHRKKLNAGDAELLEIFDCLR